MRKFTQYHDPVRILGRRVWLFVLFCLCLLVVSGVWGAYKKREESYSMRQTAEAELRDVTVRKEKLETTITELSSARGTEAALRERYSLGKEGEQLVVIVDPDPKPQPVAATTTWDSFKSKWFGWW